MYSVMHSREAVTRQRNSNSHLRSQQKASDPRIFIEIIDMFLPLFPIHVSIDPHVLYALQKSNMPLGWHFVERVLRHKSRALCFTQASMMSSIILLVEKTSDRWPFLIKFCRRSNRTLSFALCGMSDSAGSDFAALSREKTRIGMISNDVMRNSSAYTADRSRSSQSLRLPDNKVGWLHVFCKSCSALRGLISCVKIYQQAVR